MLHQIVMMIPLQTDEHELCVPNFSLPESALPAKPMVFSWPTYCSLVTAYIQQDSEDRNWQCVAPALLALI